MANFELEYIEIGSLLYPSIEIGVKTDLENFRKYGLLRRNYQREQVAQIYCELLLTDKLTEHFAIIDKAAFAAYYKEQELQKEPLPFIFCNPAH